ncbi:hypothetical protein PHK61_28090 [Actinomycetospora lutea]|uniref:hypothetical protein n=1 Tax=Actinomycetospora lutea TaxID=663604 RepID=UPI002367221C|nr:hypothetical protein [Actinomycetospora lutea]MDD7942282.1 hypothetical protein [Actinomycetospora lutea]
MKTTTRDAGDSAPSSDDSNGPESMSRGKRLGVSMLIVLILLGVFASSTPSSALKDGLLDLTRPYLLLTGIDQSWGVFAPNPPRTTNHVFARVDRDDGTVGVYPMASDAGLPEYWNYRWRKYAEQLWRKPAAERERVAFARWTAEQDRAAGHWPVTVTLVRSARTNPPPATVQDASLWREVPFFTLPVGSP